MLPELNQWIARWQAGDESAFEQLHRAAYGELRKLAGGLMRRERTGHTLQPTALVHEAFLRLAGDQHVAAENKTHFFGIAANVMRQILIQHARQRHAAKRGGGGVRVTLDEGLAQAEPKQVDAIDLEGALARLAELDPRQARIVELRFYGGLGIEEIAADLEISPATVKREWATAKAWLYRRLHDG